MILKYSKHVIQRSERRVGSKKTLPLGGFVNHNVHSFIKGCLTLKLSLSWNTVIISFEFCTSAGAVDPFVTAVSPDPFSFSGEMGI